MSFYTEDPTLQKPVETTELLEGAKRNVYQTVGRIGALVKKSPDGARAKDILGPVSVVIRDSLAKDLAAQDALAGRTLQVLAEHSARAWLVWTGLGFNGVRHIQGASHLDRPAQILGFVDAGATEFIDGLTVEFDEPTFVWIGQDLDDPRNTSHQQAKTDGRSAAVSAGGVASGIAEPPRSGIQCDV